MANFNVHINTAAAVSGILSVSLVGFNIADEKSAFYCFIAGIVGGILPDIDHNNSTPIKIMKFILSNLAAFLIVINYIHKLKILELAGLWIAVLIFFEGVFSLLKKFTVHRGILHSIPMAILLSFGSVVFFYRYLHINWIKAYCIAMFLFIGYLVHLFLDEIYSVDITNKRLKKSFGTALKFFSKNPAVNLLVYSLIIGLFFMLPGKEKIFYMVKDLFNV